MEVVVPVREFSMESETTSPYVSAPSSPRLFAGAEPDDDEDDDDLFEFEPEVQSTRRSSNNNNNNPFDLRFHYCSAPSSPTRAAALFAHFSAHGGGGGGGGGGGESFVPRPSSFFSTASMVPFDWEEKPGTPKARFSSSSSSAAAEEFAFDFEAGGPPPELASADELFDRGRIRPLKPPPRLQQLAGADGRSSPASSPRSPRIRALLSPRRRRRRGVGGDDFDPFAAAIAEATKERGRDSSYAPSRSRSRKGSRSLSPLRVGVVGGLSDPFGNPFEPNPNSNHPSPSPPPLPNTTTSSSSSSSSSTSSSTNTTKKVGKRWRLSDLLLFRSASDGRITTNRSKDRPTFKYSPMSLFSSSSPSTVSPSPSPSKVALGKNDSISKSTNRDDRSTNGVEEDTKKKKKKRASFAAPVHFFSRLRSNPVVNRFSRGFTNSG